MDWEDITSYRQGDKERIPASYEKRTGFLRVVVTRSIHGDRGAWYLRSNLPGLDMVEVGRGDDPVPAQRQALKLVKSRLAELAQNLEEMKDD